MLYEQQERLKNITIKFGESVVRRNRDAAKVDTVRIYSANHPVTYIPI